MKIVSDIRLSLDEEESLAFERAKKASGLSPRQIRNIRIGKRSVDARNKRNIQFVYTMRVEETDDPLPLREERTLTCSFRPVVVGFGPAGMFCALTLARRGLRPIVLERGSRVEERKKEVENYWKEGRLNPACNVQFGEGGAGTFSDGKLTTLIGDPLCNGVLEDFVAFGASPEIVYTAKPHIGTDRLPGVVANLRREIERLGGEIRFDTRAETFRLSGGKITGVRAGGITFDSPAVVLAVGHSARDSYSTLLEAGVAAQPKAFSVGVRIEHLAENINRSQYGDAFRHPKLGAADYKLVWHDGGGNSAYTFCMCPGGSVVASSSEQDGIVTNGMSAYARDGRNSNSALLVGVNALATCEEGMAFQRELEHRAWLLAGNEGVSALAPCQTVGDFLAGRKSRTFGEVLPTYRPGTAFADFGKLFDERISRTLKGALAAMDRKLHGFCAADALLTGPETRSSSPLRFLRGEDFMSVSVRGLYPCGEGCGYAGGIMSAAVDGIRVAEAICSAVEEQRL